MCIDPPLRSRACDAFLDSSFTPFLAPKMLSLVNSSSRGKSSTPDVSSAYFFSLFLFHPRTWERRHRPRDKAGDGQHDERDPNHGGKHPERDLWQLVQQWDQMRIIHVKARQQDDIRPNRPDNMGNHPPLPKQAHEEAFATKSSCRVATESESIAHQRNEEEVGICRPTLSRQDGGRQEHQGVGPQIACSETRMTPPAFRHSERHNAGDHRRQSCPSMHDEREKKGERDAKDEHSFFPPDGLALPSHECRKTSQPLTHVKLLHDRSRKGICPSDGLLSLESIVVVGTRGK